MGIESNQSTEFDDFVNAGEVEVGQPEGQPEKKGGGSGRAPKEAPANETPKTPKSAPADDGEEDEGADDESGEEDEEEEKPKKKSAKDHQIERLKREKSDLSRRLRALEGGAGSAALERKIADLETRLTGAGAGDTKTAGKAAPDPSDTAKYPLGHLDDRYIEDKLEWLAEQKAGKQAETALQRQQELERNDAVARQQQDILSKVDDLAAKGEDVIPDFQELVVDTGMRGDWDLQQPTFEACHEADNGAQILYELSQDPKEARRVARLSPYQQLKYVQERDAELSSGKPKPNRKPQAGEPPKNTARGANSKTQINPATDNLDDFEKQWKRDEKGKG